MQKPMTAGLIGAALALAAGAAGADERGVLIRNTDPTADAYITIVDENDGDKTILDHYRMNHGETYSVTPAFTDDHRYALRWRAERVSDGKSEDGECTGLDTPCDVDLNNAR